MIIQGGSKARHNRELQKSALSGQNTRGSAKEGGLIVISNGENTISNNNNEDKPNDTLSFESSDHSSDTEKKD